MLQLLQKERRAGHLNGKDRPRRLNLSCLVHNDNFWLELFNRGLNRCIVVFFKIILRNFIFYWRSRSLFLHKVVTLNSAGIQQSFDLILVKVCRRNRKVCACALRLEEITHQNCFISPWRSWVLHRSAFWQLKCLLEFRVGFYELIYDVFAFISIFSFCWYVLGFKLSSLLLELKERLGNRSLLRRCLKSDQFFFKLVWDIWIRNFNW